LLFSKVDPRSQKPSSLLPFDFEQQPRPPPLPIAPFLSLSQIQNLTVTYDSDELQRYTISNTLRLNLFLSRASSNLPLPLKTFTILQPQPTYPTYSEFNPVPQLYEVVNPVNFVAQFHNEYQGAMHLYSCETWHRLENIKLVGYRPYWIVDFIEGRARPVSFTFDLSRRREERWDYEVDLIFEHFPFPEGVVALTVVVASEEKRGKVWTLLRSKVEHLSVEERARILSQVEIQIKEVMSSNQVSLDCSPFFARSLVACRSVLILRLSPSFFRPRTNTLTTPSPMLPRCPPSLRS